MKINKSALTMLLIGTLVGSCLTVFTDSLLISDAESTYNLDVNGDGAVNVMDMNCLKTHLLAFSDKSSPTETPIETTASPLPTVTPTSDIPVSDVWKPNKTPDFVFPDENDGPEAVIESVSKIFNELGVPTDDGLELSIIGIMPGEKYSTLTVSVQNQKWNNEAMISGVDVSAYYNDRYNKLAEAFNCKIPYNASGFSSMGFEVSFIIQDDKIIFMLPTYMSGIARSEKDRINNETYLPYYEMLDKAFSDMSLLHYIVYKESARPYLISDDGNKIEMIWNVNSIYGLTTDIIDADGNQIESYSLCLPDGSKISSSHSIKITIDKETNNITFENLEPEERYSVSQNKQALREILNENMSESACVTVKDENRSLTYYQLHDLINKNIIYNGALEYSFIDISISADESMRKAIFNKFKTLAGQTLTDDMVYTNDYVVAMNNGKVVAFSYDLGSINKELYDRFRNADSVIAKAVQDTFGTSHAGHIAFLNSIKSYSYNVTYDSKNKATYKFKTEKMSDDLVRVSINIRPIILMYFID